MIPPKIKNIQNVGIIYSDAKREYFPNEETYITEKDAEKDAQIIKKYLEKIGYDAVLFAANDKLTENLQKNKPDFIFNLTGSVNGIDYLSAVIPGILQMLKIPFSGANLLGESLGFNKFLVKQMMQNLGISVPRHQLFVSKDDPLQKLKFPVISKLNEIHGSVDINANAVSENEKELRARLEYLINTYHQGILVEEYIFGPEATAIVLEGGEKQVFLAEKKFTDNKAKYQLASFDCQWSENPETTFEYQKIEGKELLEIIEKDVWKAFRPVGMRSYGKFDVKFSGEKSGTLPCYHIIDANSNPAFGPKECHVAISNVLELYGIDFYEILDRIMNSSLKNSYS